MRVFVLLAIASVAAACNAQAFACGGDDECELGGEPGLCVAGNCGYPDPTCPSGYRYAAGLANGLAGQCVSDDDVAGSDTEMGTGSGPATASTGSTSTGPMATSLPPGTDASTSTTDGAGPTTPGPPSTTGPDDPDTTTDASATTTAAAGTTAAPSACLELDCADCMRCVDNDGEACADVWEACAAQTGCPQASGCMELCVDAGSCTDNCCAELDDTTKMQAIELHACRMEACDEVCEDIEAVCR
jgi:hypothetical protein